MANTLIQLKRSAVAGKVPNTTTLSTGELALNLTDKKLFSSDGTNIFEMNANNANNSSYLGGTAAASFVQNTDSRTLSGNLYFTGANVYLATSLFVGDNSSVNTSAHFVGNSTVNTNITAGAVNVNGAILANNSGLYPASNTVGQALGNTLSRWAITASTIATSGLITASAGITVAAGAFTSSFTGANFNVSSQTTGGIYLGGPTQTGPIVIGVSTNNQTMNIATGATISGNVKTINFGTSGVAGSTTNIIIGTALSNSFITINANTANIYGDSTTLTVGNSSVYSTINSSAFSGAANTANTANNSSYLGGTAAASYVQNTDSRTLSGNLVISGNSLTINNNKYLRFQTLNSTAYAYFVQQNDDNFVFYTADSTYGAKAVFSVYANTATTNLKFNVPTTFSGNLDLSIVAITANGSTGSAGQVLTTNGSSTYWATVTATATVNQAAQYTWTNTQTFSANISFTGNGIGLSTNTGAIYLNGLADANWKIGRNTGATTKLYYSNNTLDIIAANSNLEGIAFGWTGNSYLETGYAGTFTRNSIFVGNSTINTAISPTSFSVFSNSTVNTVINATSITTSNTTAVPFVANSSGIYTTGVANAATHSSGAGFTANSTLVNAAAINITGAVNSATLYATTSANIASVTLANATGVYTTGTVNAATHTSGSGFIANATAIVGTGYANITTSVNSALFTVGTTFTANATLVNAAAINITGQTNTATFFAATSANVGANVQANTTALLVSSNSTVNTIITATSITQANTTATPFVANVTGLYHTGLVNAAAFTTTGNANAAIHYAGANVYINATAAFVSTNSTVNTIITATSITQANTTATPFVANVTGLYHTGLINAAAFTTTGNANAAILYAGANVYMNATTVFVSTNATMNTVVSANQITLNGSNVVTVATALKVYYANGTQAFP